MSVLSRPAPEPDRRESYGSDPDQVMDMWPGGEPGRPTVVIVHGGFWRPAFDRVHARPMATALHEAGWPVISLEYRRIPGDPEASVADVDAGIRAAGGHGDGVVTVGHSAGGHLVLLQAATHPESVRGTVALAPVADLALGERRDLGGGAVAAYLGGPASGSEHLDPARLPAPDGPVAIVHGDRDDRVPLEISESYVLARPGPRLVAVPGADHFAVIDPLSGAWPAVVEQIRSI
ncbi:alpha/beta hydrolase family protein [Pseudonocardia endophytica]|uniref:Acetyl esterase/lipase n=1 Tax=Pseudonocardia endophytica TaxID=401976 RepID=A0A4R1I5I3_PSEEN|nr:alpha/beta hydrolase [Pseudonocardia endophytica]TCK27879.1 acetyl esterase/lipase [Pseudonocardia endophytica]